MDRIWSGFTLTLVLLIAIGTAIGLGLARMGVDDPELALVPAVIILWLIDGTAGGLAGLIAASIVAWFFFLPPSWSFRISSLSEFGELVLFVCVIGFVCYVIQGQKNRIAELLDDNLALNRRLLEREALSARSTDR